jgi:hypothetical protein
MLEYMKLSQCSQYLKVLKGLSKPHFLKGNEEFKKKMWSNIHRSLSICKSKKRKGWVVKEQCITLGYNLQGKMHLCFIAEKLSKH